MKHGKKYRAAVAKYDLSKKYDLASACKMVQDMKFANFDETIEAHVSLRLEKNATVRDTLVFPNQFRGEKKVLVFCKGDKVKEALDAGAAYAGEEYIEKVKGGWLDFDVAVATPDMMKDVGRLGMVLGRKGLMPNPKTGTVTMDVKKAVEEVKAGRVEYRTDSFGNIHGIIGKASFSEEDLLANLDAFMAQIIRIKPATVKGEYIKNISISSTMGPGIKIENNFDK